MRKCEEKLLPNNVEGTKKNEIAAQYHGVNTMENYSWKVISKINVK
jgi:hypothetical protein